MRHTISFILKSISKYGLIMVVYTLTSLEKGICFASIEETTFVSMLFVINRTPFA